MRKVRHRRVTHSGRQRGNPKEKRRSRWTNPKKTRKTVQERQFSEGAIQGMSSPTSFNFKRMVDDETKQIHE
jgi:hypothetical protein